MNDRRVCDANKGVWCVPGENFDVFCSRNDYISQWRRLRAIAAYAANAMERAIRGNNGVNNFEKRVLNLEWMNVKRR